MLTLAVVRRLANFLRRCVEPVAWARAAVVAILLSTLVAAGVIINHERQFRVHAVLEVTPPPNALAATDTHLTALLATEWRSGRRLPIESRLRIRPVASDATVTLHLEAITDTPETDRRNLDALVRAYTRHYANRSPTRPDESPALAEYRRRRTVLDAEIAKLTTQVEVLAPRTQGPVVERRRTLATELAQRRSAWQQAGEDQRRAAGVLSALAAAPIPAGTVSDTERTEAEATSFALEQEREALLVRLLELYGELQRAKTAATPAIRALRETLDALDVAVTRQRKDKHGLALAATLERISVAVADFRAAATDFAKAWKQRMDPLARPETDTDALTLRARQTAIEALVADFRFATHPLRTELTEHVATIGAQGEALTQRLVIQNALRGPQHRVETAAVQLEEAIRLVVRRDNFKLDGASRTAEGLAERVGKLRGDVADELQSEADKRAAANHANQIEQARRELDRRDEAEDSMLRALLDTLGELLEIDTPYAAALDARVRLTASSERLAALQRDLARLRPPPPSEPKDGQPDTLSYTPARFERIDDDETLWRHVLAAVAASILAVFAVVMVVAFHLPGPDRGRRTPTGNKDDESWELPI